MKFDQPLYIGIDGCRGGWIVACIDMSNNLHHFVIKKLDELPTISIVKAFIDIPLAFATDTYRSCEIEARALLGARKAASIFLTPCRQAALAESYLEANRLNRLYLGKGLSIQSWNITKKILEAMSFKKMNPAIPIFESHPELSFYYLNKRKAILPRKTSVEGVIDRLALITDYAEDYTSVINKTLTKTMRKDCKLDDIIDATILAIRSASADVQQIPKKQLLDESGFILF